MQDKPTALRVPDPGVRALFTEASRWQAWLDVETALARAEADLGITPVQAATEIAAKARLEYLDQEATDRTLVARLNVWSAADPRSRGGAAPHGSDRSAWMPDMWGGDVVALEALIAEDFRAAVADLHGPPTCRTSTERVAVRIVVWSLKTAKDRGLASVLIQKLVAAGGFEPPTKGL